MSDSLPPVMTEPPKAGRFPRFAAIYSLLAPFIVFFIYLFFVLVYGLSWTNQTRDPRCRWITSVAADSFGHCPRHRCTGTDQTTGTQRHIWSGVGGCLYQQPFDRVAFCRCIFLTMAFRKNHPTTREGRLDKANQKLAVAAAGEDRFYALDDVAKESFVAGRIEDARKYATELLTLAPDYESNWNYGNAIQDGNLVLGRIAVREGRLEEAKQYLLAAGKSKGSPQMDSFGPNMSLAKDLLEKGERDTVLQYFELCRKFWTMDYGKLDDWRQEVKAGKIPGFWCEPGLLRPRDGFQPSLWSVRLRCASTRQARPFRLRLWLPSSSDFDENKSARPA